MKALKAKADRFAQDVAPILADIETSGITTLAGIAGELNAREIRNARGGIGSWTAATVSRLRRRLCPPHAA